MTDLALDRSRNDSQQPPAVGDEALESHKPISLQCTMSKLLKITLNICFITRDS